METGPHGSPSPHDARETLQQLSADADAVRYPPLPRWFFLAQAALVAAICLAQLLPPSDARNATFAAAIAAIVLGGRYWLYRDGVSGVTPSLSDMGLFLAGVLGTVLGCLVVEETTGAWWIWIVGAVVVAGIVLGTGHNYRKAYGDAA
jgi:drug/metabolite transporter (DMT)-like permease